MPCLLGIILCCLHLAFILEGSAAAFIAVPENTIVFLHSKAVLQCSTNPVTPISWFFESMDPIATNAIFLHGNLTTTKYEIDRCTPGQYNLVIESADLSHAGTYRCSVGSFGPKVEAKLAVIDPEVKCQTNASAPVGLIEKNYLWMTCSVIFSGKLNLNMTWIRNSTGYVVESISTPLNQFLIVVEVESSDDGETFAFKAAFGQENNPRQTTLTWNYTAKVFYAPTNLVVTPVKTVYEVGDRINCSADGNPIPSYEWTDAGNNRTLYTGSVLTIDSSVQPERNHSFKCTAYNNVAGSRKHVSETVTFSVIKTTDSSSSSHGSSMTLVVTVILIICVAILIAMSFFFRATVKAWTVKHSARIADRVPDVVRSDLVTHDNDYCEIGDLTHEGTTALTSMPRDERLTPQVHPGFSMYDLVREEDIGQEMRNRETRLTPQQIPVYSEVRQTNHTSTITHQGSNISEPLSSTRIGLAANQTSYFGADGTEYAMVNSFQQERQVPTTPKLPMFRPVDNYSKIDHTQRAPTPPPRL